MPQVVPADVPERERARYLANLHRATKGSGRLMLMAGDQKVEHLNDDFVGDHVAADDGDPAHLFRIASAARIGAFATQLGLIARYAGDHRDVPYVVKLNAKTHLLPVGSVDPLSRQWHTVEQVVRLREGAGLNIVGIGYTIYPGSTFEAEMLVEAARAVFEAHQHGLLAILWAYPRGKSVLDERDPHLIAGAAGLAACLGADFVKVNAPHGGPQALREAVRAAGRTGLVCAGGSERGAEAFLAELHAQINQAGAAGSATGRNIHQRTLVEAVRLCNAITAIDCDGASLDDALRILHGS
jgi:class I fructose-bisphosphate aldolase/fructose-bisphosphate aldolase/6-deoxy-5-ketofructose 1-phosphate synthase